MHSLRRTKATLIYRRTGNLRAVQLLGHTKIESTGRYLGIGGSTAQRTVGPRNRTPHTAALPTNVGYWGNKYSRPNLLGMSIPAPDRQETSGLRKLCCSYTADPTSALYLEANIDFGIIP